MSVDNKIREVETAYLDQVVKKLKDSFAINATPVLVDSIAAEALHNQAVRGSTDLVVMATHGRSGLSRFWLGSMADTLIRTLPMPVLLVRPQEEPTNLASTFAPRHILIPLNGSELAEEIIESAIELGKLFTAEYTLLRVVEPYMSPLEFANQGMVELFERRNSAYVERVAAKLRDRSLRAKSRVVLNRPAAVAILDVARAENVDLIALATHGRSGLSRALLGSVADKVIRGAQVPVLTQRPGPIQA